MPKILIPSTDPGTVGQSVEILLEHRLSLTGGDGATSVFNFGDPILQLVVTYVGGIAQFPIDTAIDDAGNLVLSLSPATDLPVSVLAFFAP